MSFGVAVVTHDCRNAKWSAKIGSFSVTRLETRIAAGSHEIVPASLWNSTRIFSSAWVMPPSESISPCATSRGNSPSVADCRPNLLLLAHDVDRAVLDGAQLVGAQAPGGVLVARVCEPAGRRSEPTWSARKGAGPGGDALSSISARWASRAWRGCAARGRQVVHGSADRIQDSLADRSRTRRRRGPSRAAARRRRAPERGLVVDRDRLDGRPVISVTSAARSACETSSGPVMS